MKVKNVMFCHLNTFMQVLVYFAVNMSELCNQPCFHFSIALKSTTAPREHSDKPSCVKITDFVVVPGHKHKNSGFIKEN